MVTVQVTYRNGMSESFDLPLTATCLELKQRLEILAEGVEPIARVTIDFNAEEGHRG